MTDVDTAKLRELAFNEGWASALVVAGHHVPALLDEVERLSAALRKVSDIRDSIVGQQGFNFSEHAYPLVAVLGEAGFPGVGYEIARKNFGTLIDQLAAMTAARDEACEIAMGLTDPGWSHHDGARMHIAALRKVGAL